MFLSSWLRSRHPSDAGRHGRARVKPAAFRPRLEALEGRDVPSTLTVTNTNDSGPGSLRAEIAAAKTNTTIVFDPSVEGTITLTSGELDITSNLTIQGPGADNLTVSGGGNSRVFEVGPKAKVTLSGLTISNGLNFILAGNFSEGGGVFNHGTLTVSGCTLSDNLAGSGGGGIYNAGTLTVSNSHFISSGIYGRYIDGGGNTFG